MDAEALIDTNIFLEIILRQERFELCESVLRQKDNRIAISDFSLNSIGIYLFRSNQENAFLKFIRDIEGVFTILNLQLKDYPKISDNRMKFRLDYDDSYQLAVAELYGLELITLDKDFRGLDSPVKISVLR
jgi:predicted nucleic acid-binding protein